MADGPPAAIPSSMIPGRRAGLRFVLGDEADVPSRVRIQICLRRLLRRIRSECEAFAVDDDVDGLSLRAGRRVQRAKGSNPCRGRRFDDHGEQSMTWSEGQIAKSSLPEVRVRRACGTRAEAGAACI